MSIPTQVLQMTEKYCLDRGISFPRIEVSPEDIKEPHECYLFAKAEDPSSPIILHFPLVNHTFRTHLAPGEGSLGSGSGTQSPGLVRGLLSPGRCMKAFLLEAPSWPLLPGLSIHIGPAPPSE